MQGWVDRPGKGGYKLFYYELRKRVKEKIPKVGKSFLRQQWYLCLSLRR